MNNNNQKMNIPLRDYIEGQFSTFNKKLNVILDPKDGIYAELAIINNKADRAHHRIDKLEKVKKEKKDIYIKIFIGIISALITTGVITGFNYFF